MQEELRKEVQALQQYRGHLIHYNGNSELAEEVTEKSSQSCDDAASARASLGTSSAIKIRPNVHYYPVSASNTSKVDPDVLNQNDSRKVDIFEEQLSYNVEDDSSFYPPPPNSPPPTDDSEYEYSAAMEPPPAESPVGAKAIVEEAEVSPLSVVLEIDIGEGIKRNIVIYKDSDTVVRKIICCDKFHLGLTCEY